MVFKITECSLCISGSSRVRKESICVVPETGIVPQVHPAKSTPQLNDLMSHFDRTGALSRSFKWRGSVGNCHQLNPTVNRSVAETQSTMKLGPGQIQPKGRLTTPMGRFGELKIGFVLHKGVLEIEVGMRSK